jgi:hypothetical protein
MKINSHRGNIMNLTTLTKPKCAKTRFIGGDEQMQDFGNVNKHESLIVQRGSLY